MGGTGGMAECQSPEDCNDLNDCTDDTCTDGMCEYTPLSDGTACDESNECTTGVCSDGECTPIADGAACGNDAGTCQQGSCQVACTEQGIRDAIAAGGGPYTFACDGPTTVVTGAVVAIDNDVILDGEGNLTVDGNEHDRVFFVARGITAELRGFTVTKGSFWGGGGIYNLGGTLTLTRSTVSGNSGGGIFNEGDGRLTLTHSTVSGNTAEGEGVLYGGGIVNRGALTLTHSTVSGNSGGGINNYYGRLTLTQSTVSGNSADYGGGIDNTGTLTLTHSTVSGNTAEGVSGVYGGGGIANRSGTLTLTHSTVSGNSAAIAGGGIYNNNGTLTLTHSTVSGNSADNLGGGIANDYYGALTLTNSTVSDNSADYGGGMFNGGTLTLTHITVSGNSAELYGGGIYSNGTLTLTNTLVDDDCAGATVSSGGNIESPSDTCGFDQPTDQVNVTAEQLNLGPLRDNGGPTMTHALLPGSVAIDQIPEEDCTLSTDQRGFTRPAGSGCDVGAFEVQLGD
jgi:predicted outer membrane repeat protein